MEAAIETGFQIIELAALTTATYHLLKATHYAELVYILTAKTQGRKDLIIRNLHLCVYRVFAVIIFA